MVNQKGEFPRSERCSIRVSAPTKRLLQKLKKRSHNEADVMEYAAKQLANEPILLEWEIDEIDLEMSELNVVLAELENKKQAKLNRLRMISPQRLDDETIRNMMVDAAIEYLEDIFRRAGRFDVGVSVDDFCNGGKYSKSVRDYAVDLNFVYDDFVKVVVDQAEKFLSDIDV